MSMRALLLGALWALPALALAQTINLAPIESLFSAASSLIQALVRILITLALVVFFWGLVRYLFYGTSEPRLKEAKTLMIWGLITLFVMVSVWGITEMMQTLLGINKNAPGRAPQIEYTGAARTNNSWSIGGGSAAP